MFNRHPGKAREAAYPNRGFYLNIAKRKKIGRNIDESLQIVHNANALYDVWCKSISLIAEKGGHGDQACGYQSEGRKKDLLRSRSSRNSWNMQKKSI